VLIARPSLERRIVDFVSRGDPEITAATGPRRS
jgi:hypothetical protein